MTTARLTKTATAILKPVLKWAGGKRQLLPLLTDKMPNSFNRYFEPFIGGGALFFSLQPTNAVISDINPELINCYQVIRDDVHALIENLELHKNEEQYFYKLRAVKPLSISPVERASRFIFLNKTCWNGLYRENKKGQFNTPFGRYENPRIIDRDNLMAVSDYLQYSGTTIRCSGYQQVLEEAKESDLIYFDSPYFPSSKTANFTNYAKDGFGLDDHRALADLYRQLSDKGVKVMLSNSNTPVVRELYKDFTIKPVKALRSINSNGKKRGKKANEVLITNYNK